MTLFKKIDWWIQVIAIFWAIANAFFGEDFIISYLVVGAIQLLSSFIHIIFTNKFIHDKHRKYYYWSILLLLLAALPFLQANFLIVAMILIFVSPLQAIWYVVIGYLENQSLREINAITSKELHEK